MFVFVFDKIVGNTQQLDNFNVNAKFFFDLPNNRVFCSFKAVNTAAGNRPVADTVSAASASFYQENLIFLVENDCAAADANVVLAGFHVVREKEGVNKSDGFIDL